MKNKIYRTDKKWVLLIVVLAVIEMTGAVSANPKILGYGSFWLLVAFMIFLLLDAYVGMYISIKNNTLARTTHFFVRRKIYINEIQNIVYHPTWVMGGAFGYSLWIHGLRKGKPARIEIANVGYSNEVISDILKTLIEVNPDILLDSSAESLLKK